MQNESDIRDVLSIITTGELNNKSAHKNQPVFSQLRYKNAIDKIQEKTQGWLMSDGVQGLGLGERLSKYQYSDELALRIYVDKKLPLKKLTKRVPASIQVPELGRVRTDVIEIGTIRLQSLLGRQRPAMPGMSIGNLRTGVGTFGCLVKWKGHPGVYMLSCAHVMRDYDIDMTNDVVLQPAMADGGNVANDVIAKIEAYSDFDYSEGNFYNKVDAALARVNLRKVSPIINYIGHAPSGISNNIKRYTTVQKVGRTTGHTTGQVIDIDYQFFTPHRKPNGGYANVGFTDQILCERFTDDGDSGAAVLNENNHLLGLHVAGTSSNSIFCRIKNVFELFNLELV